MRSSLDVNFPKTLQSKDVWEISDRPPLISATDTAWTLNLPSMRACFSIRRRSVYDHTINIMFGLLWKISYFDSWMTSYLHLVSLLWTGRWLWTRQSRGWLCCVSMDKRLLRSAIHINLTHTEWRSLLTCSSPWRQTSSSGIYPHAHSDLINPLDKYLFSSSRRNWCASLFALCSCYHDYQSLCRPYWCVVYSSFLEFRCYCNARMVWIWTELHTSLYMWSIMIIFPLDVNT